MKFRIVLPLLAIAMSAAFAQRQAAKPAPDFKLQSAESKPFSLSAQRGHKVLISFYKGYY